MYYNNVELSSGDQPSVFLTCVPVCQRDFSKSPLLPKLHNRNEVLTGFWFTGFDLALAVAEPLMTLPLLTGCTIYSVAGVISKLPAFHSHPLSEAWNLLDKLMYVRVTTNYWGERLRFWLPDAPLCDIRTLSLAFGVMMLLDGRDYDDYSLKDIFPKYPCANPDDGEAPPDWLHVFINK